MGDRGNIKIISAMNEAPPLYFYTHWNGSELPVIIVTSLGSEEHRRLGLEVRADAYVVKSSFETRELLEVVEQLL